MEEERESEEDAGSDGAREDTRADPSSFCLRIEQLISFSSAASV